MHACMHACMHAPLSSKQWIDFTSSSDILGFKTLRFEIRGNMNFMYTFIAQTRFFSKHVGIFIQ